MKTLVTLFLGLCLAGASLAQTSTVTRWFDGERWIAVTANQGSAQAAGGLFVHTETHHLAKLERYLTQQDIAHQRWNLPNTLWLPSAPGQAALLLTHRLEKSPVPVRIEPNWALQLRRQ
jgi:hypothetical protein